MDLEVLPGPSLPEPARTALARTAAAIVSGANPSSPAAARPILSNARHDQRLEIHGESAFTETERPWIYFDVSAYIATLPAGASARPSTPLR